MSEEKQEKGLFAPLKEKALLTKEQALMTGGALLASGVLDVATHFDGFCVFAGVAGAFLAYKNGSDILDFMVPGRHNAHAMEVTSHFVDAVASEAEENDTRDQSAKAKVKRLLGMTTPPVAQPKDNKPEPMYTNNRQVLRLGTVVETSRRFDPPVNTLLGEGLLISGGQGAGKSNLTGLVCCFAAQTGMPEVIFDFKGEFYTLCETITLNGQEFQIMPNGIRVGHPDFEQEARQAVKGDIGYYPLTPENAAEFAAIIMDYRFQAVIDVPSYQDLDELGLVMANLLNGLMAWSQDIDPESRIPCLVVTDEAQLFLPQRRQLGLNMSEASYNALQKAYGRIANTGRSYGYTMVLATQRIANLVTWSYANLQKKVVMKHTEENDLDRCEKEISKATPREVIKKLPKGHGVVIGFTDEPMIVAFDKQPARHVSNTPMIDRLTNHAMGERPRLSRVLARMPKTDEYAPFDTYQDRTREPQTDPALRRTSERRLTNETIRRGGTPEQRRAAVEMRRRGVEVATKPVVKVPETYQKEEQRIPTLQEVIAAFPENKPSKREIMTHFGITDHQAYKLYKQLDEIGG